MDLVIGAAFQPNEVHKNMQDNTFMLITTSASSVGISRSSHTQSYSLSIGDYDQDGRLDVLVGNELGINELHRNIGGKPGVFAFEEITTSAVTIGSDTVKAIAFADVDNECAHARATKWVVARSHPLTSAPTLIVVCSGALVLWQRRHGHRHRQPRCGQWAAHLRALRPLCAFRLLGCLPERPSVRTTGDQFGPGL